MQTTMDRSFFRQAVGAAKLDRATYDAVARDPSATTSAALVVALASLAAGLAAAVDDGLSAIALAVVAGFVFWALSAVSAWYTGVELIRGRNRSVGFADVLRALGFAQAPGIVAVAGVVPEVSGFVTAILWIWTFLTSLVAIRQVFGTSTARAVAISLVAFIVALVILGVAAWVLGTGAVLVR